MQLNGIVQQRMDEKSVNQITEQGRDAFQMTADKFVAVANSDETIFAGCREQKEYNIMTACGALLAQTLVKREYYTEGLTGDCVKKLNMTSPAEILARSETGVPGSEFISRWSDLEGLEYSAQDLYDMLSKELHKQESSPEMLEKIRTVLKMAEKDSGSESIRGTEYAEIVECYGDEIKNAVISDILIANDINEAEHGPVLEGADIIQLELMKDISFHSLNNY
ncbi:TPA: hypothetical protein RG728_002906 [Morganella morganii subsp. morganii]|nr:hypothetical protein [Morganella morganii]EKW8487271.1 hypothetical protein [Morganella morganii]HAT3624248.1 hypothetical protein [Morganella morganii]HCU0879948.1 hypothetical protein [Morganella morganii]HDU8693763.1 hypothetical protein [Morganella morganii subsp. morganii]